MGVTKPDYPGAQLPESESDDIMQQSIRPYGTRYHCTYNANVDPISYGHAFGYLRKNCSGGGWYDPALSGSRGVADDTVPAAPWDWTTSRGCNNNLLLSWGGMEWQGLLLVRGL